MDIHNVLFLSSSVIYKKIVRDAIAELSPLAGFFTEITEESAIALLKKTSCELVIIDSAIATINCKSLLHNLMYKFPNIQITLLCDQKELDRKDNFQISENGLNVIIKPIHEGYESNFKTVKRGIRLAILKYRQSMLLKDDRQLDPPFMPVADLNSQEQEGYSLLLIAASTGGPNALDQVLSRLPKHLNIPTLVVQHMPPGFTKNLANTLNRQSHLTITEAEHGDELKNNHVFIAPGGFHMVLDDKNRISLSDCEYVNGVRPSADVLFFSVAKQFQGKKILAVILTGMGSDGTEGVRMLKKLCKCYCIAQNEESSTVYGMPRAVTEAKLCDKSVHLTMISTAITRVLGINPFIEEGI